MTALKILRLAAEMALGRQHLHSFDSQAPGFKAGSRASGRLCSMHTALQHVLVPSGSHLRDEGSQFWEQQSGFTCKAGREAGMVPQSRPSRCV